MTHTLPNRFNTLASSVLVTNWWYFPMAKAVVVVMVSRVVTISRWLVFLASQLSYFCYISLHLLSLAIFIRWKNVLVCWHSGWNSAGDRFISSSRYLLLASSAAKLSRDWMTAKAMAVDVSPCFLSCRCYYVYIIWCSSERDRATTATHRNQPHLLPPI